MHPEGQAPEGTAETGTSRRFALIALALAIVAAGWYGFLPRPSSFPALVLAALAVTMGVAGLSGPRPDGGARPILIASLMLGVSALVLLFLAGGSLISSVWADPTAIALAGLGVALGTLGNRRTEKRWILSLIVGAAVLIALGSVPGLADLAQAWAPLLLGPAAIVLGLLGLRSRGGRGIAILALVLGFLMVAFVVALWVAWRNCC